jgi:hypothetical protein
LISSLSLEELLCRDPDAPPIKTQKLQAISSFLTGDSTLDSLRDTILIASADANRLDGHEPNIFLLTLSAQNALATAHSLASMFAITRIESKEIKQRITAVVAWRQFDLILIASGNKIFCLDFSLKSSNKTANESSPASTTTVQPKVLSKIEISNPISFLETRGSHLMVGDSLRGILVYHLKVDNPSGGGSRHLAWSFVSADFNPHTALSGTFLGASLVVGLDRYGEVFVSDYEDESLMDAHNNTSNLSYGMIRTSARRLHAVQRQDFLDFKERKFMLIDRSRTSRPPSKNMTRNEVGLEIVTEKENTVNNNAPIEEEKEDLVVKDPGVVLIPTLTGGLYVFYEVRLLTAFEQFEYYTIYWKFVKYLIGEYSRFKRASGNSLHLWCLALANTGREAKNFANVNVVERFLGESRETQEKLYEGVQNRSRGGLGRDLTLDNLIRILSTDIL